MRIKFKITMLFILLALGAAACAPQPATGTPHKLQITVSVLPQKYFVERIGGDDVLVNVMVGPGESPHSYEPKASQMRALSQSVLYLMIGVEFENAWIQRFADANPNMRLLDLSTDIDKLPAPAHDHDDLDDEHGIDEEYQDGLDPHIWTSPELVKVMAEKIYTQLVELNPQRADYYQANLAAFLADIEALQADIRAALAPLENRKFMVFHPAWGYFAREFGLQQVAIEIGGSEPSASQLAALLDEARREGIRIIFAQPEFSTRSAETIAREIGGSVILISPLEEDWLENLRSVAQSLADNL